MRITAAEAALSDAHCTYGPGAVALYCLSFALVAAIAEPLLRYALTPEPLHTPHLATAIVANTALVGGFALLAGFALALVGLRGCGRSRAVSAARDRWFVVVIVALVIALVGGMTAGAGFGVMWPVLVWPMAVALACSAAMTVWRRLVSGKRLLPPVIPVVVVFMWLACVLCTGGLVLDTYRHLSAWTSEKSTAAPVATDRPNILLVVADTLRADRVGVYGDSRLTPQLDRFASSSYVYTEAISTAPWTLPTHASLFTGLYPDRHGVSWGHYRLDDQYPVLARLLGEAGYETFGISNNWLLSRKNGFARGFADFVETPNNDWVARWRLAMQCGAGEHLLPLLGLPRDAAHDAGSAVTNWLMGKRLERVVHSGRPFFAFINYFEPHDPYLPLPRFRERYLTAEQRAAAAHLHQDVSKLAEQACGLPDVFTNEQIDLLSHLYDAEVAYQDEAIGDLLAMLDALGVRDNTWIVIMADHGELFGEQGMVYHTASSHYSLLHIPLLVRPPGGADGRRIGGPVQPVDVFETLVDVAGVRMPEEVARAYRLPTDRNQPNRRTVAIAETHGASIAGLSIAQRADMQANLTHWLTWVTSVYADGWLLEETETGPRGLFHVAEDPFMRENRLQDAREKLAELSAALAAFARSASDRTTLAFGAH